MLGQILPRPSLNASDAVLFGVRTTLEIGTIGTHKYFQLPWSIRPVQIDTRNRTLGVKHSRPRRNLSTRVSGHAVGAADVTFVGFQPRYTYACLMHTVRRLFLTFNAFLVPDWNLRRRLAEHRGAKEWHSRGGSGNAIITISLVMIVVVIVIIRIAMMIKALHHYRAKTSEARPKR